MTAAPSRSVFRAEDALQRTFATAARAWSGLQALGAWTPADFRGRACHCDPAWPKHYVHSEGLREACDFVVDFGTNVRAPGRPMLPVRELRPFAARLGAGATVHVKTDRLDKFVAHLLPELRGPVVLVTGDSDAPVDVRHRDLLAHPKIAHWFAQNCLLPEDSPKLTRVPIGLDNPVYTKLEKRLGFALTMLLERTPFDATVTRNDIGDQGALEAVRPTLPAPALRPLRVLCTFHQNQKLVAPDLRALPPRAKAAAELAANPLCHFVPRRLPQRDCWRLHGAFTFEASPPGNGADCFRTWEALLLGTIPIVPSTALDPLYRGFPVVIVSSWAELTPTNLARWAAERQLELGAPVLEKLSLAHWVGRIKKASLAAAAA